MANGNNPTTGRADPLPVFCFKVKIDGLPDAFFKSVSGLKYETETIPVREGGANNTTFMLVGATKWSPIVLKNGFTGSSGMLAWREKWISPWLYAGSPGGVSRMSGVITQLNTALKEVVSWKFFNGWPTKWELGELDASKSELAIETLEITHEGLQLVTPKT
jgi:phage tail-like protein